ncbi:EF-hand domain-containing protein [Sphingomonas crusticola]|uniref:EF-hand domain-containing protein n=1 Tax=Sphingomonas crusticola TaxID=1697973 RepID=UPI000E252C3C|nr:EF-hand domain-containing protein [Sphingomonas crusticola]
MLALALAGAATASSPKLPSDAPACAAPETAPIFLSPMGEPFRAAPGQPYPSAVWFAAADRNQDGMLSRDEMVADAMRFFRQLDTNHDGRLTPDEVGAYESVVAPETSLFAARPDGFYETRRRRHEADAVGRSSEYGGAMGAGRYAWLNIPEPVAAADQDIDRVVTGDEFAAAADRAFTIFDHGGRGGIKLSEFPRTRLQIAIEGPCRPAKVQRGASRN